MKAQVNPFVISGYEGTRYFCDRRQETIQLQQEIANYDTATNISRHRPTAMASAGGSLSLCHLVSNQRGV